MFTIENLKNKQWRGQTVGRIESDILYVLSFRFDDIVPMQDIIDFVYPDIDKEPIDPSGTIRVIIGVLRKKFGSKIITTTHGWGYKINS